MPLPTNLSTGLVSGQFFLPDGTPAQGTIRFTPGVQYLPDPTAAPWPATILNDPVTGVLDVEGFLCRPDETDPTLPGAHGAVLIAGDDPDLSVQGWTWTAHYAFTNAEFTIPDHAFFLPSDGVLDLTTIVKVPTSTGVGTAQAAALTATAQAAATASATYAADAADSADAVQAMFDNATATATASALVKRDSNGRAKFGDPAAAADAATKGYTDAQVATRAALAHTHPAADISDSTTVGRAVVTAADAAAARTAIGAGTSSLALGTTGTTAMAGNKTFTKTDVGLGNVDNTSDANKPVSTAAQAALDAKAPLASPAFTGTPTGITKTHVGLGNVDNTSDANKPVSTAQAAADALKQDAIKLYQTSSDITVNNSTTPVTATGLALPVAANTTYEISGSLIYSASQAADIAFTWTYPAGCAMNWIPDGISTGSTSATNSIARQVRAITEGGSIGGAAVGTKIFAFPKGMLITSSTAGTVQLMFAQNTLDATDTVLHAGSYLKLTRLA